MLGFHRKEAVERRSGVLDDWMSPCSTVIVLAMVLPALACQRASSYPAMISGDTDAAMPPDDGRGDGGAMVQRGVQFIDKIVASDSMELDSFGRAIAADGDLLVVGAPHATEGSPGKVYVFERSGNAWLELDKLSAADGAVGDTFGTAVAISGTTIMVGAPLDDDGGDATGSVYVYERSGSQWEQAHKISATDANASSGGTFGASVALSGSTAVVGAPGDDESDSNAGAIYILERQTDSTWLQSKLLASDPLIGDRFGWSVDIVEDRLVVGVPFDNTLESDAGAIYVFERSGGVWSEDEQLLADDGTFLDQLGWSVGMAEDLIVAGVNDEARGGPGAIYVFEHDGNKWIQTPKIQPDDAASRDMFGASVSSNGELIVAGAFFDDDNATNSGSLYLYTRNADGWNEYAKLSAADGEMSDSFGISVTISGRVLGVGANVDDGAGSAYVLEYSNL